MTQASISAGQIRQIDNFLKGYLFYQKSLYTDHYAKEYFSFEHPQNNPSAERTVARAHMFEIRHFILELPNGNEKLLLYHHYIKGHAVERCAELLGISRTSAFRMRKRALALAFAHFEKNKLEESS